MNLIKNDNIVFFHTPREGNHLSDNLAKLGGEFKTLSIYHEAVVILFKVRDSIKFESGGLPNFRFRRRKNIFIINIGL